ncbi:OmcA/MtrC family decaheme c-type cytochrome [Ferrimonas balearica]|uniref:OmcA/MtrC family decaheme c-type cytochrome n=1 Tax=Ferrimonas balearica TaxID=44012 RepID=UPI001C999C51|nr:OmcA/MtrC family decaheme c-type cytochrome [Ferrimonas balearica]MBY5920997.1 OmcA/MtrC family decaheme c-type cytochrome [Ferrimonas balearica]MBY5996318.1 OmcA/MtrC family decaheme c-type cytochrome [Ferrimonas balearica]
MTTTKQNWKLLASAAMVSLALSGCGSDGKDGSNGEDGKPGPVGVSIGEVSGLTAKVDSASVDEAGILTLEFTLTNSNGVAVYGLTNADIGAVSFGRMGTEDEVGTTDVTGEPRDIWLSYFNKDKGEGHLTGSSYFKGSSCEDCLTDNEDGTYTLVLNKAIDTLAYEYDFDATATNGLYLGLKAAGKDGATLVENSFYYWQPSSDTVVERPKELIAETTCQSCHRPGHDGALSMHGSKHVTLESCTFCHTDYNSYVKEEKDENGTVVNTFVYDGSIKGMAHDIHSHSFYAEDGIYPQKASNCQTCHQPDEALELAGAWKADLDSATCLNCHNSPYAVPSWHWDSDNNQIAEDKQNCVQCHNADGARGAEAGHYTQNANGRAPELKVQFDEIVVDATAYTITATFSVLDGEELVPLTQIDPRPYKYGGFNSAIVVNGLHADDFLVNYQKVGFDTFTQLADGRIQSVITDGTYKVKELVDAGATIALSSQLHVCFDGKGARLDCVEADLESGKQLAPYLVSDTYFFEQDGTVVAESPRVQHAEMGDCQACHTTSITHRYTNDLDGCASCHNGTRDKKGQGSSNLAYIVHSKHYLGGFFKKTDCQTCHGANGFTLSGIAADAAPVAFGTTDGQRLSDTNEQLLVSPQTAACVSCHVPPYGLNDTAVAHIKSMGGVIDHDGNINTIGVPASEYDAYVDMQGKETCATCHTGEQILDAHSNWSSGY